MHQKSLRITSYYTAPQWQQVVDATDTLLDMFATHLGSVADEFGFCQNSDDDLAWRPLMEYACEKHTSYEE